MKFFPVIGAAAAFFSLCFACAASTPSDEAAADPAELFRRAPDFLPGDPLPLRGVPLWHTNDMLSRELIHEMIFRGKENGFGGYAFLPVDSTLPKYLTEEYFDAFGYMLRQADEAGMKIVFYDDIGFPSGTAGGELQKKFPDAMAKRLDKYEWKVTGPCPLAAEIPIPLSDSVEYGVNAGVLQAAVAMNTVTNERVDISGAVRENTLVWDVPEGEWLAMVFVCAPDPFGFVDYLSPDAVRKFMSLTYDQIDRRFPGAFGTTIPMTFFDDLPAAGAQGDRNWTLGFNEKYREMYHREPALDYPALFYSIGDETPSARCRLWATRARLFSEGYPKVVHEWTARRGVLSSGHPQGPYTIGPIDMCNDPMLTHRYSDVPLFDSIHYYGHGRNGFKVPTSAAENFDKDTVAVEVYGDYRNDTFDTSMMYRALMEIFARGGNFILPHGAWSDPGDCYIDPVIGWQNPAVADGLKDYGSWVSRCCTLLRHARTVEEVAVVYPIDALQAGYHFPYDWLTGYPIKGDYPRGLFVPEETDYMEIGAILTSKIYRDFLFVHPETLDAKCTVRLKDGAPILRLDNARDFKEFKLVVLTGSDVISASNMRKILEFYRAGGKVLGTTRLPSRSTEGDADDEVCAAIEEIFGIDPAGQAFRPSILTGQEDIVLPESFRRVREFNRRGFYRREPKNPVLYDAPVEKADGGVLRAVFLPRPTDEAMRGAVDRLLPSPDVDLIPDEGTVMPTLDVVPRWDYPIEGMCQYVHKVKWGRDVYYLANSSNETAAFTAKLRGSFKTLEIWNPHTGEITPAAGTEAADDAGVVYTRVPVTLAPASDTFLVGVKE